jgi:hypothetical protein
MTLEYSGIDAALDLRETLRASQSIDESSKAPSPLRSAGALQIAIACFVLLAPPLVRAQQPFYTDDADVTDQRKFHLQISNEFDLLQRSAYPSLRQNTAVFELDYGLLDRVEIGVDGPLIAIMNSRVISPRTPFGFGDLDLHIKYNFLKEREGSRRPALTATFSVELPTGDAKQQLGSGFTDYSLNGVLQKSLTKKTTLRLNGGILFAGSTATGDIGIKTRGRVFIAGGSIVKQVTHSLDLGAELTGAISNSLQLSHGQLQTLVGGNYQVTRKMSFDFGIVAGKYNSPRAGLQLGISVDF